MGEFRCFGCSAPRPTQHAYCPACETFTDSFQPEARKARHLTTAEKVASIHDQHRRLGAYAATLARGSKIEDRLPAMLERNRAQEAARIAEVGGFVPFERVGRHGVRV